jgi:hypothetical protein
MPDCYLSGGEDVAADLVSSQSAALETPFFGAGRKRGLPGVAVRAREKFAVHRLRRMSKLKQAESLRGLVGIRGGADGNAGGARSFTRTGATSAPTRSFKRIVNG